MHYIPVLPLMVPLFAAAFIAALSKLIPQPVALAISLVAAFITTAAA